MCFKNQNLVETNKTRYFIWNQTFKPISPKLIGVILIECIHQFLNLKLSSN